MCLVGVSLRDQLGCMEIIHLAVTSESRERLRFLNAESNGFQISATEKQKAPEPNDRVCCGIKSR